MTSTGDVLLLITGGGAASTGVTLGASLGAALGAEIGAALGATIALTKVAVAAMTARQGDNRERRTRFGEGGRLTAMVRGELEL